MKKFLLIFALLLGLSTIVFAENYNDIVVYELPSYCEAQAKSFLNSINSNGAFYTKKRYNYLYLCFVKRVWIRL